MHLCPIFRQQLFEFDQTLAKKDDDVFHFVAYLPINGRLYELDGLQEGPLDHGKCDESDWVKSAKPVLEKRMNRLKKQSLMCIMIVQCFICLAMLLMRFTLTCLH